VHSPSMRASGKSRDTSTLRPSSSAAKDGRARAWSAKACLTDEQVIAFVSAGLTEAELAPVDQHLDECPWCASLVIEAVRAGEQRAPRAHFSNGRCWTLRPGDRIGNRYDVVRTLGQGGMSDVFEAFDSHLQQPVALKTARATRCDLVDEAERLSSEFRLGSRVLHANVCRPFELGVHGEQRSNDDRIHYFTMDLIRGSSLARWRRMSAPGVSTVLVLGRELLRGVAAIHHAGVIHRDIKSSNIMLRDDDISRIAIIDFGLAVSRSSVVGAAPSTAAASSFEGSPAYMAPEQFRGSDVTPATDVFACGAVLFEALTGRVPFCSLRAEKTGPWRDPCEVAAPASAFDSSVPRALERFIARCLEIDPAERYCSADEALRALDAVACSGRGEP